ncbi:MAG: DUF6485 family protein [candidate division WOR-3 bacterium]
MRTECRAESNRKACTCTYEACSRKGRCCECISYHRQHKEIPGCLFPPEAERTYDRSIKAFLAASRS